MRRLLVVVLVVLLVLVGLDRGGKYIAEQAAADTLKSSQHLATAPDVTIAGFPFLTQFGTGHYDHITVLAHDVDTGSSPSIRFSTLRVVLNSLTVSRDFTAFHAAAGTANGVVGYPALSRILRVNVGYAGAGRVRITKTVTVLGSTVHAGVSARPTLARGALSFAAATVAGLGQLPQQTLNALTSAFHVRIALRDLPFQISVTSLTARANGLHFAFAGSNLSYTR